MSAVSVTLEILGALGVFIFGMKVMSEALQKVAGARLKGLLAKITSNRVSAVFTGFFVTTVIQSSSATTVMVVGFVTAGLLSLTQAIGVVMGANIGTTVTGWLVALLGFKVKISAFALPAVGIGFVLSFMRKPRTRYWGEALIGFGLLFLGLSFLKGAVPDLEGPEQLAWMRNLAGYGFGSVVIFVAIGTVLTVVLQSSSATMTLTLTLAALGWLPYHLAAAMVLGENIGTTATANLAAIGAPVAARRAARAHFLFNIFGVVWALVLMQVYLLNTVDWLVPGDPNIDFTALQNDPEALDTARGVVTTHLALFHTLFNITNTLVMLPLVGFLVKVVTRWVPDTSTRGPGAVTLRYLGTHTYIKTPQLVLAAAGKEMQQMVEQNNIMFADALRILSHPEEDLGDLVRETLEREELVDKLEIEIQRHLTDVARASTNTATSKKIAAMLQNTHRLERIADHCAVLVRIGKRLRGNERRFTEDELSTIARLGELVAQALLNVGRSVDGADVAEAAEALEKRIDTLRAELRNEQIERLRSGEHSVSAGLAYLDVITHLEEIGDRCVGIVRHARHLSNETA